ncbi:M20/M25/M40 family metallo-hydrolase [Kordiimonas aquimaris]|uniref:M20/M25/M40 family metallo-hydrolase n=1 Tax=Kordiimonas aquimaris TaxID=707591 RepID=UPI0021CE6219|nr:M20/M25/M40 family metallo-hydrolase [Kordiimonas aquimaris]
MNYWKLKFVLVCSLVFIFSAGKSISASELDYVSEFRSNNALRILNDFKEFLSIPNTGARKGQKQKNAEWITEYIAKRGFDSQIVRAGGAPYVIAERLVDGATTTVLFYAHFDGQPAIAENWASPPFEPTLRAGTVEGGAPVISWPKDNDSIDPMWRIFARSAGDDKAPVIALMAALDAMQAAGIQPSINIKLILDGEEEIGSPTLDKILKAHGNLLKSDLILFCDAPLHQSGKRQLVYGMRGAMTLELETYGPARPLHSGHYGNWAPNPTDIMIRALNSLKNEDGSIAVANFYDDVPSITPAESAAIAAIPNIDDSLKNELALAERERPEKRIEELVMEPAIVIKGFQAGGVEDKSRNIIQPTAKASINFRLVKNQTPRGVERKIEAHFRSLGYRVVRTAPSLDDRRKYPRIIKLDWRPGGYGAFKTPLDGKESLKLVSILDQIDGQKTMQTPTLGGSLPIVVFERNLKAPIIVLPIANHDNNQHGRNENMRIQNLWDAISIYAAVIQNYGK